MKNGHIAPEAKRAGGRRERLDSDLGAGEGADKDGAAQLRFCKDACRREIRMPLALGTDSSIECLQMAEKTP